MKLFIQKQKHYFFIILCLPLLMYSCRQEKQQSVLSPFAPSKLLQTGAYGFGDSLNNGILTIRSVHDTGFSFVLEANHGDNEAQLDGVAQFLNDSQAFFREDNDVVEFTLHKNAIAIVGRGLNGTPADNDFNGEYLQGAVSAKEETITGDVGFLDQQAIVDLKAKAGDHYDDLSDCMAKFSEEDAEVKDGVSFKVYSGGIAGLYTLDEAVMLTRDHYYYAGLVFDDTVHLYTNDPIYLKNKKKLPTAIATWIPDMSHSRVAYHY